MRLAYLSTYYTNRVEILFDKLNQQLPNFARCVEVCLEVGTNVEAGASTLASIRD